VTIHSLQEYIKYQWKAMTRHGVHSPFVYEFIEKIIQNKSPTSFDSNSFILIPADKKNIQIEKQIASCYLNILGKVIAQYEYSKLLAVSDDNEEDGLQCDLLILSAEPKVWIRLFNRYQPLLNQGGCIVITGIHKTHRRTGKWNRICNHPKVKMSIDLYGIGLLFFRDEFREKQKFVLRH